MSLTIANLIKPGAPEKSRAQLLELVKPLVYDDGRTKQCHRDECDIEKIMARFSETGTISHLQKFEGVYADFSDFDFQDQQQKLSRGREIFDALPAELRQEFGQSPAAFFRYVNDPRNVADLRKKLPGLAQPGRQLPNISPPDADTEKAAAAAASEAPSENNKNPPAKPATPPPAS